MLKGFNYPLTPNGKSTLNPPPPWYYSADYLNIEFWSDPAPVSALLPPGLEPDKAADGHGNALFYDWQFTGANEEYLDPARYQYREFFLLVDAPFEGKPVAYCPYIFVDNDAAIARVDAGLSKAIGTGLSDPLLRCDGQCRSRTGAQVEVRRFVDRERPPTGSRPGHAERTADRLVGLEATTSC